ncbi:hypothetical protein BDQ17DRAFT_1384456 [Cyathus striatus]|nr:hypothetical protein BDQ17DRAFT_1384456 [Cyathus striatus]
MGPVGDSPIPALSTRTSTYLDQKRGRRRRWRGFQDFKGGERTTQGPDRNSVDHIAAA